MIEYYVVPDYLAIGHDTNYYLCPMTPILGQCLADSTDCMLPARKTVDQIRNNAPLHMNPESIPPSPLMTTLPVMNDHNNMVWVQRQPLLGTYPLGTFVAVNKKDVVISNQIYSLPSPARVLIYGWHYTSGTPIQPLCGGHILVSGAEIGWYLDEQCSSGDQQFYNQTLKADYLNDALAGINTTYYRIEPVAGSIFDGLSTMGFDDGTNGTYDVDWPDVLSPIGGSTPCISYPGLTNEIRGIQYQGLIGTGLSNAKFVNLGVPIEAIYPDAARDEMMLRIINFFRSSSSTAINEFRASAISAYPNPFCSSTSIAYNVDVVIDAIVITNMLGEMVKQIENIGTTGILCIELTDYASGLYICQIISNGRIFASEKLIFQR